MANRYPNIKLFITQGVLQSTDEAITAGVPLIGVPMFGDQWNNVERYEHHKVGIEMDLETLDEEQFKNAITTVIGDERYRQNIAKPCTLMYDQPQPPLCAGRNTCCVTEARDICARPPPTCPGCNT